MGLRPLERNPAKGGALILLASPDCPGQPVPQSGKAGLRVSRLRQTNRRCAMSQLDVADRKAAGTAEKISPAYVPSLQRTAGQPPPIAAHGGLSYMSFAQDGDAGTAVALQDALAEIAEGEGQRVVDMIDKAPPGAVK